jgi:hypothetical protein
MSGVNVAADGLGIGGPKGPDKILLNWALLRVPGRERYLPPDPRRAIPGRPLERFCRSRAGSTKMRLLNASIDLPSFEIKVQLAEIPWF